MKTGDRKLFNSSYPDSRENLTKLISYFKQGWRDFHIAKVFGCHHTSIRSQRIKLGFSGKSVNTAFQPRMRHKPSYLNKRKELPTHKYQDVIHERVNRGSSYAQYLQEQILKTPTFYRCIYVVGKKQNILKQIKENEDIALV